MMCYSIFFTSTLIETIQNFRLLLINLFTFNYLLLKRVMLITVYYKKQTLLHSLSSP